MAQGVLQESIARSVVARFPESVINIRDIQRDVIFEITLHEKLLVALDKKGVRYYFPTRFKRNLDLERITKLGEKRVVEYILRDLAEANYLVLSDNQKPLLKKPIHVSRYKNCPACSQQGSITMFLRGEYEGAVKSGADAAAHDVVGAEIICRNCGWIGVRRELPRKSYFPRPC